MPLLWRAPWTLRHHRVPSYTLCSLTISLPRAFHGDGSLWQASPGRGQVLCWAHVVHDVSSVCSVHPWRMSNKLFLGECMAVQRASSGLADVLYLNVGVIRSPVRRFPWVLPLEILKVQLFKSSDQPMSPSVAVNTRETWPVRTFQVWSILTVQLECVFLLRTWTRDEFYQIVNKTLNRKQNKTKKSPSKNVSSLPSTLLLHACPCLLLPGSPSLVSCVVMNGGLISELSKFCSYFPSLGFSWRGLVGAFRWFRIDISPESHLSYGMWVWPLMDSEWPLLSTYYAPSFLH